MPITNPPVPLPSGALVKAAAVVVVNGLNLTAPSGTVPLKTYSQLLPDETNLLYPCTLATSLDEAEGIEPGSTAAWDYVYAVRFYLVDRIGTVRHDLEPWLMSWRQQLFDAFRDQPLYATPVTGGTSPYCYVGRVFPSAGADPKLREYQYMVSSLLVKFWSRQEFPAGRRIPGGH